MFEVIIILITIKFYIHFSYITEVLYSSTIMSDNQPEEHDVVNYDNEECEFDCPHEYVDDCEYEYEDDEWEEESDDDAEEEEYHEDDGSEDEYYEYNYDHEVDRNYSQRDPLEDYFDHDDNIVIEIDYSYYNFLIHGLIEQDANEYRHAFFSDQTILTHPIKTLRSVFCFIAQYNFLTITEFAILQLEKYQLLDRTLLSTEAKQELTVSD